MRSCWNSTPTGKPKFQNVIAAKFCQNARLSNSISKGVFSQFYLMTQFGCALVVVVMLCKPWLALPNPSLSPPNGRSLCGYWALEPSWGKVCTTTSSLSHSGNYVFYLGDTYSYFNVGYPAALMAHYSNKWGKRCGVGDPFRATGPSIQAHLLRQGNVYHWHLRRTETKWQAGSAVRRTLGLSYCKHIHLVRLYSCGCQATA